VFTYTTITLFPELIDAFAAVGLARKARGLGLLELRTLNPRDFATDNRRTVDDVPYGGGPGMIMQVAPLREAIAAARAAAAAARVIYLSPQGRTLRQSELPRLLAYPDLILLAGRYEGIDERLVERDVDEEISVGDYVLSGGEVPAMVLMDALIRLIPGVLGAPESARCESFVDGLLDFPQYTRPEVIGDQAVPPILLSGNHAAIAAWRLQQAVRRTQARRPDLLQNTRLLREDARALLTSGRAGEPQDDRSDA
jgi:tRNA (guanine37-N1)-methyltransferase